MTCLVNSRVASLSWRSYTETGEKRYLPGNKFTRSSRESLQAGRFVSRDDNHDDDDDTGFISVERAGSPQFLDGITQVSDNPE